MIKNVKVSAEEFIRLTHLAAEYSKMGLDNGNKFIDENGVLESGKILFIEKKKLNLEVKGHAALLKAYNIFMKIKDTETTKDLMKIIEKKENLISKIASSFMEE